MFFKRYFLYSANLILTRLLWWRNGSQVNLTLTTTRTILLIHVFCIFCLNNNVQFYSHTRGADTAIARYSLKWCTCTCKLHLFNFISVTGCICTLQFSKMGDRFHKSYDFNMKPASHFAFMGATIHMIFVEFIKLLVHVTTTSHFKV